MGQENLTFHDSRGPEKCRARGRRGRGLPVMLRSCGASADPGGCVSMTGGRRRTVEGACRPA